MINLRPTKTSACEGAQPTVLTIMLSRSMRKLANATVATMMESLMPVTYSRSSWGSDTDSSFFSSARGCTAHTEAALDGANSPLDFWLVAIVDGQVVWL